MLLTSSKRGPLADGGWDEDMMYGVVTERSKYWIKVAYETGPDKGELQHCDSWRCGKLLVANCHQGVRQLAPAYKRDTALFMLAYSVLELSRTATRAAR